MGMRACDAANTVFMVGMYCDGAESDTEMTRIRACRVGWSSEGDEDVAVATVVFVGLAGSVDPDVVLEGAKASEVLLMWDRARVRAPAIKGVVGPMSVDVVLLMRSRREERMDDSICANCGYLLAEVLFTSSPSVVVVEEPWPR